jgi:hypothetical protein
MEIIKVIHDLTFALVVVAVVLSPRAISTYLALREAKNREAAE